MRVRKVTEACIELVKRFERFYPKAYYCPANYLTIGYGHIVKKGESLEIDEDKAEEYLAQDLLVAEIAVCRLINVPLEDCQYDALVSWTFNLGGGALQRSTMRMKLNRGEYESVPYEMQKWVRAGGKILRGLIIRRREEAIMFQGGWIDGD